MTGCGRCAVLAAQRARSGGAPQQVRRFVLAGVLVALHNSAMYRTPAGWAGQGRGDNTKNHKNIARAGQDGSLTHCCAVKTGCCGSR